MSLSGEEKRARLAKALEYGGGTHTVDDVVELCRQGKARCWDNEGGLIITEVHAFPRLRAVHYWTISGVLPDCLALDEPISKWAISEGCSVATATGRKGWGRAGAPYGWLPQPNCFNFYKVLGSSL